MPRRPTAPWFWLVLLTVALAVGDCAAASVLTPHHLPVECRFSVTGNRELERYRAELNGGADFPLVADQLRPGRRIGG